MIDIQKTVHIECIQLDEFRDKYMRNHNYNMCFKPIFHLQISLPTSLLLFAGGVVCKL